jgi:rare lipoprotein A
MPRVWVSAVAVALAAWLPGCARERPAESPWEGGLLVPGGEASEGDSATSGGGGSRPPPASAEEARLEAQYGNARPLAVLHGEAAWYGSALAGRRTASGEIFDPRRFTAAHRTLAFGTVVRVVRTDAPAVVYVRITDRGPYGDERRIIDLSRAAAEHLGILRRGVATVRVEVLEYGAPRRGRGPRTASLR